VTEPTAAVTVVVVNFNTGAALARCVQSALSTDAVRKVIVVDNASGDDSLARLEQAAIDPSRLVVVRNARNLGFARAVNAVARDVSGDWLLVLNPDCELAPGAVERLWQALAWDPSAALAAPRVESPDGHMERASLRRFPRPWNSFVTVTGLWRLGRWWPAFQGVPADVADVPTTTSTAEAVSGACMLMRREALQQVGYFDEAYGLHCEDLDLMVRLQQAGWHCLFVPEAAARHAQGLSSRSRPLWVHWQKHRGMARFYAKFQRQQHAGPVNALVWTGIWLHYLLGLPAAWLRR